MKSEWKRKYGRENTCGLEAGSEGLLDLGIGNLDFIWCWHLNTKLLVRPVCHQEDPGYLPKTSRYGITLMNLPRSRIWPSAPKPQKPSSVSIKHMSAWLVHSPPEAELHLNQKFAGWAWNQRQGIFFIIHKL